jgi:hypothetical protein
VTKLQDFFSAIIEEQQLENTIIWKQLACTSEEGDGIFLPFQ